ncbi:MAG: hypothetical protein WDO24_30055 [Pseudomonadota bacterium]
MPRSAIPAKSPTSAWSTSWSPRSAPISIPPGFAIIPKDPSADLLESALQRDQRGSKLALVFGDDPENIAGLYRQMVGRQRVA